MSLLGKYKAALRPMHGWRVELNCRQCGQQGLPRYEGWMPDIAVAPGEEPTVYAKVACPRCGRRLTEEAGEKLVALFGDVTVPEENRRVVAQFITGLFIVPAVFAALIFLGVHSGWWGYSAFAIFLLSAIFIQPVVMAMKYRVAKLRLQCACGKPGYLLMGMLQGTSCFRCSHCGRLLRLRD